MSNFTTNQELTQADFLPATLIKFENGQESVISKDLTEDQELSILVSLAKNVKRRFTL